MMNFERIIFLLLLLHPKKILHLQILHHHQNFHRLLPETNLFQEMSPPRNQYSPRNSPYSPPLKHNSSSYSYLRDEYKKLKISVSSS